MGRRQWRKWRDLWKVANGAAAAMRYVHAFDAPRVNIGTSAGVAGIMGVLLLGAPPAYAQLAWLGELARPSFCVGFCATLPRALSGDGSTPVGTASVPSDEGPSWALRWSASGTVEGIGPTGGFVSAQGVSRDGHVIVGNHVTDLLPPWSPGRIAAWRMGPEGLTYLDELPGTCPNRTAGGPAQTSCTTAGGVSADGNVVVGTSRSQAFRWSLSHGISGLGALPGHSVSGASGVSADGSVIVGSSSSSAPGVLTEQATRWTAATGMQSLGVFGYATAVSADGRVVVGATRGVSSGPPPPAEDFAATQAFRWTASSGAVVLAPLDPAVPRSVATAVSGDGAVVVGYGAIALHDLRAFRWTAGDGVRRIDELLAAYGVDVSGWKLVQASGVSEDGRVIVGSGVLPGKQVTDAWIARVPLFPGDIGGIAPIDSLLASAATMSAVALSGERLARFDQSRILDVARHYRAPPPGPVKIASAGAFGPVDPEPRPWSLYAVASAQAWNFDPETQGTSPSGAVGVLYDGVAGWRLGVGASAASASEDVIYGGRYRTRGAGVHAFAAWSPGSAGWRAYALADYLRIDADIDRGYMNGNGLATSSGSTQGAAYGALVRAAYALAVDARSTLTPYADYAWSWSRLDAYVEDRGTGPFPAAFDDQRYSSQVARGGLELAHDRESHRLWAWVAWAKRTSGDSVAISGQYIGLTSFAFQTLRVPDDQWWEAGLGASITITPNVRLIGTAGLVAAGAVDQQSSFQGSIGLAIGL